MPGVREIGRVCALLITVHGRINVRWAELSDQIGSGMRADRTRTVRVQNGTVIGGVDEADHVGKPGDAEPAVDRRDEVALGEATRLEERVAGVGSAALACSDSGWT